MNAYAPSRVVDIALSEYSECSQKIKLENAGPEPITEISNNLANHNTKPRVMNDFGSWRK